MGAERKGLEGWWPYLTCLTLLLLPTPAFVGHLHVPLNVLQALRDCCVSAGDAQLPQMLNCRLLWRQYHVGPACRKVQVRCCIDVAPR